MVAVARGAIISSAAAAGGDEWGDVVDAVITPDADGTRDFGTSGTRFATGYFNALDLGGQSLTGSQAISLMEMAATWNTTGTPTALKLDVTDTASNAASLLMDLQVGGSSKFIISKDGSVGIGIAPVAGTRLTLPLEDDAITPTLAFGDGDTGFYERVDDDLRVSVGGVNTFLFFLTQFRSANGLGPALQNRAATNAVPTLIPDISDDNTGIGQAAADQLSLIAGGVEQSRWNVTGNHIINSLLDAATGNEVALSLNYTVNKATSGNDTGLLINQTDTLSPGTSLLMDIQQGGTSRFVVDAGGNVGIGTALPLELLEIRSDSDPTLVIGAITTGQANSGKLVFKEDGAVERFTIRHNGVTNDLIIDSEELSNILVIDRAAPLLIGMGEPGALATLHITSDKDALTAVRIDNTNSGTSIDHTALTLYDGGTLEAFFRNNNNTHILSLGQNNVVGEVAIFTGGSEVVRIDDAGSVGIGTIIPNNKFHVVTAGNPAKFESTSGSGRIEIDAPTGSNAGVQFFENNVLRWGIFNQGSDDSLKFQDKDFVTRMSILQTGEVGIGVLSPSSILSFKMGTGTGVAEASGKANVNTTAVGTDANTTEKDLMTYSLPANSLSVDGKLVKITAWGTTAANGNSKTMKLYFGATVVRQLGTSAFNNQDWIAEAIVVRTGASAQDAIGTEKSNNSNIFLTHSEPAEDTTTATTIRVTGQNGTAAANDIVAEGMLIEYLN